MKRQTEMTTSIEQRHRRRPLGATKQWLRVYQMVFDAMHSNGALRRQISTQVKIQAHVHVTSPSSSSSSSLNEYHSGSGDGLVVGANHINTNQAAAASSSATVPEQNMSSGGSVDGWQRKPLLRHTGEADNGEEEEEEDEEEEDENEGKKRNGGSGLVMWQQYSTTVSIDGNPVGVSEPKNIMNGSSGGMVKISLPPPERDETKFPKEKWKTLLSFLFLCANWVVTTVTLAIVHERLPDRSTTPPLPDVVFDMFPPQDWALAVSEVLIIVSTNTCLLSVLLHKHRFILLRRSFLILGVLYLMRSLTMFVTQVPVASTTYYCSPKANSTSISIVVQRSLQLLSGFGLSINGQHTYCGDYIYSGHTIALTMTYMMIKEYTPRRCSLLHWVSWLTSVTGVVMVLLSRGHYTVDVVIAYYVTTRVFWIYHTMANNQHLKVSGGYNYLSKVWWFCLFDYFERNVGGVVPRQYECPIPWPRRFAKRDRDS